MPPAMSVYFAINLGSEWEWLSLSWNWKKQIFVLRPPLSYRQRWPKDKIVCCLSGLSDLGDIMAIPLFINLCNKLKLNHVYNNNVVLFHNGKSCHMFWREIAQCVYRLQTKRCTDVTWSWKEILLGHSMLIFLKILKMYQFNLVLLLMWS